MEIKNYLRARVFNSSFSALQLARKNPQYAGLARNIVSVKQSSAIRDLIISHLKESKCIKLEYKINKYHSMV